MKPAQLKFRELLSIYRRRKRYLFIPAAIITGLSVIGAIFTANKYESSTTILVQRDEILNPLISYQMAVGISTTRSAAVLARGRTSGLSSKPGMQPPQWRSSHFWVPETRTKTARTKTQSNAVWNS